MSIELPRNRKELHFTGSVKALAAPPAKRAPPVNHALGRERPKAPPQAPPSRTAAADRSERAAVLRTPRLMTTRGQFASVDDDLETVALRRDEVDAALLPLSRRPSAGRPSPKLPVPGFRGAPPKKASRKHRDEPRQEPTVVIATRSQAGSLPLAVWLMAAIIAGIASYQIAPGAAEGVAQAVRALDRR